jgi:5'-phosphate synthase pdxT subunit
VLGHDPERVAAETVADRRLPRLTGLPPGRLEDRPAAGEAVPDEPLHERADHVVRQGLRDAALVHRPDTISHMEPLRIGVLAVQGNFREHAAVLRRLGVHVVEVRKADQLDGLDGLVIPGGESTTFTRLMRLYGLDEAIRRFERPVFGTCAGMIVLDRAHLDLVDVRVQRNAFGRQVASFETDLDVAGEDQPIRAVFIRAPWIEEVGADVEVLAEVNGRPVLARDGRFLVASFHPELTDDTRLHERFLELVREAQVVRA